MMRSETLVLRRWWWNVHHHRHYYRRNINDTIPMMKWRVAVDCHVVWAERSRGQLMDFTTLKWSFFSAAFDARVVKLIDEADLDTVVAFLDFRRANFLNAMD